MYIIAKNEKNARYMCDKKIFENHNIKILLNVICLLECLDKVNKKGCWYVKVR